MDRETFEKYLENNAKDIVMISEFAYILHDIDVNQKYDDKPYSYHLKSVLDLAKKYGHLVIEKEDDILPVLFAAAYHDSIEDARLTYNDVMKIAKKKMTDDQAYLATEIVYALTNEKGRNRDERANYKYYEGIRITKYAPFVKMCDRLANMTYSASKGSSMIEKYKSELPHFLSMIGQDNIPIEMIECVNKL